jgi:hypothetical protein
MRRLLSASILYLFCIALAGAAPAPSGAPKSAPAAAPAQALKGFQGIIDMTLALEAGSGDLRLYMAGERAKLDMSLQVAPLPSPIKLGVLLDSKTPKVVWIVNDNLKTYSYLNLADSAPPLDTASAGKYVIKVLGKEKRLGYDCTHLTLTRKGELVDAWIAQDFPDVYAVLKKLQEANPQYGDLSIFQALEGAGKSGLPLKYIVVREGQRVTMEIRKIERKALPGSLFTVPMDYQKTDGAGAAGLQPTAEQVEEMKKMIQGALQGQ